jgi:hypothetical protein
MASVKISNILNNREEYFAILRSLTNDPQAQLDLESNKHRSQVSSFNLKNVLRSIDLNSNNQIEKDEFEKYYKSIVRDGKQNSVNEAWSKLLELNHSQVFQLEDKPHKNIYEIFIENLKKSSNEIYKSILKQREKNYDVPNIPVESLKRSTVAISRSPQVIDEEGIVNRSATSASGVIHKIFKNVDGKDMIYILTAAHVDVGRRSSVVLPNGIVAKPESISEPEDFNKTDIQVLRIAIPSDNRKNSELVALDIDKHDLKKQDPLLKAGFSRLGMQPVCGELGPCLPSSLKTIKKAQALTVPAKFGDGSLFNSPLLVIDGTNVMKLPSVKSPDAIFSGNKEKLKKMPYLLTGKMAATPGDSGGPIISKNIQLVGLVSQGNTLDLNSNVSMPVLSYHRNEIRKIIDNDISDLRKNTKR